ncbi:MAG: hypothetical protein J7647_01200 [Cyanobacteria bacterium SBLK]|nr:hypothetical protein [Cyanobacteria bacterium SBLK]
MPRLTIDSKKDCYVLDEGKMNALQDTANSIKLEPGTYVVRINQGAFNYWADKPDFPGEPWVLLWIYGGKFINKKTNIEVGCTWSSLNGFDDTVTLEILETTTLCGLFFDTYAQDNTGAVTLSILKDE